MKIRTLRFFSIAFSLFFLFSCAGGNKLASKQLTFSDLLNIQESSTSGVRTFMSKKGWKNTTDADIKNGLISEDELSWTLSKDARSPKLATLSYYPEDDLFESELTYQTTSKANFDQMIAEAKANKKHGLKLCDDKSHAKTGRVHYYDYLIDVYFTPAKTGSVYHEVSFVNSY